jgi:hypothetical protein
MFYYLAMGLKLNQVQQGLPVTRDIQGLYEIAQHMEYSQWNDLLTKYDW